MNEGFKRITILSDTHSSESIPERVEKMKEAGGDINITIGDVFDSEIRNRILDEFKKDSKNAVEDLSVPEKEIYDHLVADGNIPIRAYWMARVQANPDLLRNIKVELDDDYELFVDEFASLPQAKWLYGNVEQSYVQSPDFKDTKLVNSTAEAVEKIDTPRIFYGDEENIGVLFPSLPANQANKAEVDTFLSDLLKTIQEKPGLKNLIFIAHEYLFRGRAPEQFKEKMAEAGIEKYFVPFYMPNNFRKEILTFLFNVPEGVGIKFVYGHLHDPKETTQAGIAFKHSDDKVGMKWAVNNVDQVTGQRRTRHFDMYQLPFQSVYTVDIRGSEIAIKPYN